MIKTRYLNADAGRNGVYLWLEAGVRPAEVLGPEDDASLELVVLR